VFYNDYDPEKPFLAFFSRRLIKKGEELCFAYHGGIDDEDVPEDEVQVRLSLSLPFDEEGSFSFKFSSRA